MKGHKTAPELIRIVGPAFYPADWTTRLAAGSPRGENA
ncbi:hypothetical protein BF49_4640 [Bradyrhizobium sp.]|nr:hypothetical protein BF49_4640 [Bradyrhizobium sp.]